MIQDLTLFTKHECLPWQQLRYGPHVGDLHVVAETCSSPHLAKSLFPPAEGAHCRSWFGPGPPSGSVPSCVPPAWHSSSLRRAFAGERHRGASCRQATWRQNNLTKACTCLWFVGRTFWKSHFSRLFLPPHRPPDVSRSNPFWPHAVTGLLCPPAALPSAVLLCYCLNSLSPFIYGVVAFQATLIESRSSGT